MATTRTGFPAIPTPRALELRPVQQSIDNIRERFQAVEAQLTLISSVVNASNSFQSIQGLQAQIAQLTVLVNTLATQIDGLGEAFDPVTSAMISDARMRAIAQEALFQVASPNDVNSVIANRVFRA